MLNRTAVVRKEWGKNQKNTVLLPVYMGSGLDMIHRGGRQGLISRMQVNKRHLTIRIGVPGGAQLAKRVVLRWH